MIYDGKTEVQGQITNVARDWGLKNLFTTLSLVKQFIGSYRFDSFTSQDAKYQNNMLSDSKSVYSLLLHQTPSSWDKRRSERNELGNTYQFYIWKSEKK